MPVPGASWRRLTRTHLPAVDDLPVDRVLGEDVLGEGVGVPLEQPRRHVPPRVGVLVGGLAVPGHGAEKCGVLNEVACQVRRVCVREKIRASERCDHGGCDCRAGMTAGPGVRAEIKAWSQ